MKKDIKTNFNHQEVDQKWQKFWLDEKYYSVADLGEGDKKYILDMFPYPSGDGLHVGHPLGYIGSDIVARYYRARGKTVLHPMGYDAFGLPTENFAIKTGTTPQDRTQQTIARFRKQLQSMGLSFDWDREVNTSSPDYYKWTQWLFIQLYNKGLAYRAEANVNWCPQDQTVLANEQVVGGRCERCDSEVEQKKLSQWFFKITADAEKLLSGLDNVDWPESIKLIQKNWIGKSEGAEIDFDVDGGDKKITVFTTRPDTLFGATYMVLAPEHPLVSEIISDGQRSAVEEYLTETKKKQELERKSIDKPKTGVFTGAYAINPASKEKIPVWIADYVLMGYGTGAIMAVPAHDERDYAFARQFDLPIKSVIEPVLIQTTDSSAFHRDEPFVDTHSVIVLVKHWSEDKYLGLKWRDAKDWGTLLTGGIDEGYTPEETVIKEISEETGYKNAKIIKTITTIHSKYYHVPKQQNRFGHTPVFYVQLTNDEREAISTDEEGRHELVWLTLDEMKSFLTPISHKTTLEIFESGVYTGDGQLVNSGHFDGQSCENAKEEIVKLVNGQKKVTYRLRDWLVSRQRYWGAPIPMIHCEKCGISPVANDQLPVLLPTDVDFKPTGESPLARSGSFQKDVICPKCNMPARRDVDTMDTFVDSSWYFLRYADPHNDKEIFTQEKVNSWLPVDVYVGGREHATGHLLFARFFTHFLHELGLINFDEPFVQYRSQGLIMGEDNRKMSKRWGNVINPDDVVRDYGADALRVFEMFMGPFEDSKPWSTQGVIGARRWLDRVWKLQEKVRVGSSNNTAEKILSKSIFAVTPMIEAFQFNTIVSQLMILTNAWEKVDSIDTNTWRDFLIILAPLAPHITFELWENAEFENYPDNSGWPTRSSSDIEDDFLSIPVQINGKVRSQLEVPANINNEELEIAARNDQVVKKYLSDKEVIKVIVVPRRAINFVIK